MFIEVAGGKLINTDHIVTVVEHKGTGDIDWMDYVEITDIYKRTHKIENCTLEDFIKKITKEDNV